MVTMTLILKAPTNEMLRTYLSSCPPAYEYGVDMTIGTSNSMLHRGSVSHVLCKDIRKLIQNTRLPEHDGFTLHVSANEHDDHVKLSIGAPWLKPWSITEVFIKSVNDWQMVTMRPAVEHPYKTMLFVDLLYFMIDPLMGKK